MLFYILFFSPAVPDERPKIEGLADTYLIGDLLVAHCTSGLGDPKPTISWYVNKQPIPGNPVRDQTTIPEDQNDRIHLKSTTTQLRLPLDKKLVQNRARTPLEIMCESSMDGINQAVAPPLISTKTVIILGPEPAGQQSKIALTVLGWVEGGGRVGDRLRLGRSGQVVLMSR
jgi:hypothetical protein